MAPAPMPKLIGSSAICVARDRHRLLGVLALQERRFRCHRDRFGSRTDLQHDVHAGRDRDLHLDVGLLVLAEARLLDGERISAYRQLQHRVIARSSGDGVGLGASLRVGEDHLDAWDHSAPAESETVPVIAPRLLWPNSDHDRRKTRTAS